MIAPVGTANRKPGRALFVLPNLAAGGVERQWSILLPGLRERGIDARLIALDGGGPFEAPLRRHQVPFEVLNMRHQLDAPRLLRSHLIRGFAPDVVISQSVSGLYVGELLATLRHATHVYSDHAGVGFPLTSRRDAMVRLIARSVDWVIAVSPDQVAPWTQRRVARERIVVIDNGVATPVASASRRTLRDRLQVPEDAVVALLVATLRPEKRVGDFIDAVIAARRSNDQLIGWVAGDGPERAAAHAAAEGKAGIHLLGHRDDVADLLTAADMFVLTSEHEAVPMSILEAMAAGLPIVATDAGGIPGVVTNGENGLLVPAKDPAAIAACMVELAAHAERRMAMGAAGARRQHERWDAARMIDRYAEFISGLCGSAPSRSRIARYRRRRAHA